MLIKKHKYMFLNKQKYYHRALSKKGLTTAIITALSFSQNAFAASSNTITFKGEIAEQTCEVTINNTNAQPVVLLPTVTKSDLVTENSSAGLTPFTLSVKGCAVSSDAVNVKMTFFGNNVSAAGNLANMGTAANVELQLLTDSSGSSPIDLRGGAPVPGVIIPAGQTAGEHDFAVQYISPTGAASAGTVIGAVQYAVTYL